MDESTGLPAGPQAARWTHLALRVADLDRSLRWYEEWTPLEVVNQREDDGGFGAWLAMPGPTNNPFVLVLAQFHPEADPYPEPRATLAPFAHLGIEVPRREDVDEIHARAESAGIATSAPVMLPDPIGYVCGIADPDGNQIEYSWNQGLYATLQERWSAAPEDR